MRRAYLGGLILAACASPRAPTDEELGATESAVNLADFTLPSLPIMERTAIVHRYDALDPTDLVPRGLLEDAIVFYDVNKAKIPQQTYVVVVDLSLYSGKDRFWLVDTTTGKVEPHKVAHGDGSDPDNNGLATLFGNVDGSHKSSLGFYLTGEIYDGTHVHSMRLDGLTVDGSRNDMANSNARSRLIVMHEATYVDDANTSQQGRSNGCLALDPSIEVAMVDRIHDGSLIYVATKPLDPAVGRSACGDATCDGGETDVSCPADCTIGGPADDGNDGTGDPDPTQPGTSGGCSSTGGGGSLVLAVAGVLAIRRRRSRA